MARRKGLGRGKGKGYKNLQGRDPKIHSDSARGRKQAQKVNLTDYEKRLKFIKKYSPKKFEKAGLGKNIKNPKDIIDIDKTVEGLDNFEKQFLRRQLTGTDKSIEKALEVMVNSVEGDLSQMSPALKEYAERKGLVEGFIEEFDKQISKEEKEQTGKGTFYRDSKGKISDTRLSPYGKQQLRLVDGAYLGFSDMTLEVKGNQLVNKDTGEVVETIDNDRMVNKIMFKVIGG